VNAVDESRLDDAAAIARLDPHQMLRAVAGSAAQLRSARTACLDAGFGELTVDDRPRAIVVAGMGGSAAAGDVLASLALASSPVPVLVSRNWALPGWVGAADLVVAVSCSGTTKETLAAADEARRRGCAVIGVGAADTPLASRCADASARFVAVAPAIAPRASLWALATPLLVLGARLGLVDLGRDDDLLEAAAARLEQVAERCHPDRESFVNPAKSLALELGDGLLMTWGGGDVGAVAAARLANQLAENAKRPCVVGALPEAHHNEVVVFAGSAAGGEEDFFRDRVEDGRRARLRLVLVDDGSPGPAARRVEVTAELAADHGVPVTTLRADGESAVERLASLVGLIDYATVYLALAQGLDPTPVTPIDALKARLADG
jgi:glucose/mannose-6-phosphate isomerase